MVSLVPDTATLLSVAKEAAARGLYLITDGRDVKISPIIPPGWHQMGAVQKTTAPVTEGTRCAA